VSYSGDDEGSSEEEEGAEADWSETLKGGYDDDEVRFLSDSVDHSPAIYGSWKNHPWSMKVFSFSGS